MAKRKRLEVSVDTVSSNLETKTTLLAPRVRMPIAEVAGDTAGRAALEEVAQKMTEAEQEGRVVKKLPLAAISVHHLSRDRLVLDEDEMEALVTSIATRGQQAPVEVVEVAPEKFGLISGLRRVEALSRLGETHVLAFVKRPETSHDAYQAMIEENEIRSNLSFFERAQVALAATEQGVYPDARVAIRKLYANAPKAKRSKIAKFVTICETIGPALKFPTAIPEHLGFKLAKAIESDPLLVDRIRGALFETAAEDAITERQVLEGLLKGPVLAPKKEKVAAGVSMESRKGRVVLSGKGVDHAFLESLRSWVVSHAKPG